MKGVYGFKMSKLDGSEYEFKASNSHLPSKYSYKKFLPPILNQGSDSTCVPCAVSSYLDWNYNVDNSGKVFKDNKILISDIYNSRSNKNEDNGMSIKEALDYLRKVGVSSKVGVLKIGKYAKVLNINSLKYALVANGPCIGALRVYNDSKTDFWNRDYEGQKILGGHAIAIVGYDSEGFIIRNSWGSSYGSGGYSIIPYEESNKFLEIWTMYK